MSIGEGILLVLGVISATIVATIVGVIFLTWFLALVRAQAEQAAHIAAGGATDAPAYRGRCRCRACRERPQEPCSDFSGD